VRKIRKKSVVPLYGMAAVCLVYCLIFPLYKLSHFLFLAAAITAAGIILSKVFPGETIEVKEPEKPVSTGNAEIDAMVNEGRRAIAEMQRLRESITDENVNPKIDELIDVTDMIFKNLLEDPSDLQRTKRFASYFLPTTIKLLNAYDRMGAGGLEGENISGTKERIVEILDKTIAAYNKQYDALFVNQALDIDTDITVLESMLKREGLAEEDF